MSARVVDRIVYTSVGLTWYGVEVIDDTAGLVAKFDGYADTCKAAAVLAAELNRGGPQRERALRMYHRAPRRRGRTPSPSP